MDIESLAAAAVYLFSTYNYYLHVYSQNNAMRRYKVLKKIKQTKQRELNNRRRKRENLNGELLADPSDGFHYVCMSREDFEDLIEKISPIITKRDTHWRPSLPAKVKLAVTLRFLATGDNYGSLSEMFNLTTSVISKTVPEVCLAINEVLSDMIKIPSSEEEWLTLSKGFTFPNCLGALDGKHITLLPSCYTGSEYVNHIGTFSIVLLTLIDSNYCFTYADIGSEGRTSDDDELSQSILWKKITSNSLNLPASSQLPGSDVSLPYVFLGDETFPLQNNIIKPFPGELATGTPQRIFNQHLARSRSVVENTFGIMTTVFRVFKKPIPLDAEKSSIITLSCLLLHNYLRKSNTSRDIYSPPGSVDIYSHNELVSPGAWRNKSRNNFISLLQKEQEEGNESAIQTRENIMNHLYTSLTRN